MRQPDGRDDFLERATELGLIAEQIAECEPLRLVRQSRFYSRFEIGLKID